MSLTPDPSPNGEGRDHRYTPWSAKRLSLLLLRKPHDLRNVLAFSIFYKSTLSYCSHAFSA